MINSKGAYTSFEDEKETSSDSSPIDGTFYPAMEHLRTWADVKSSRKEGQAVAFANFGYTEKQYRLYCGRYPQFHLMKDVTELLSHIYGNNFQVWVSIRYPTNMHSPIIGRNARKMRINNFTSRTQSANLLLELILKTLILILIQLTTCDNTIQHIESFAKLFSIYTSVKNVYIVLNGYFFSYRSSGKFLNGDHFLKSLLILCSSVADLWWRYICFKSNTKGSCMAQTYMSLLWGDFYQCSIRLRHFSFKV